MICELILVTTVISEDRFYKYFYQRLVVSGIRAKEISFQNYILRNLCF